MTEKVTISTDAAGEVANAAAALVEIYTEPDGTTYLLAEIPGAKMESVDLSVDKGVLTVSADGARPAKDPAYSGTYTGFEGGRYYRAFALGDEVDRDNIEATLTDGVLTVKLPRAAAAHTRKIQIKG